MIRLGTNWPALKCIWEKLLFSGTQEAERKDYFLHCRKAEKRHDKTKCTLFSGVHRSGEMEVNRTGCCRKKIHMWYLHCFVALSCCDIIDIVSTKQAYPQDFLGWLHFSSLTRLVFPQNSAWDRKSHICKKEINWHWKTSCLRGIRRLFCQPRAPGLPWYSFHSVCLRSYELCSGCSLWEHCLSWINYDTVVRFCTFWNKVPATQQQFGTHTRTKQCFCWTKGWPWMNLTVGQEHFLSGSETSKKERHRMHSALAWRFEFAFFFVFQFGSRISRWHASKNTWILSLRITLVFLHWCFLAAIDNIANTSQALTLQWKNIDHKQRFR